MAENQDPTATQGRTFVWHEVYGPSEQVAIDFYTKALGFGTQSMEMGEGRTYHMLTREGQPVCGVISTNDPRMSDVPPHWATYLSVPDVDAALESVKAHGGSVEVPPMNVPTVGRMALIIDPQGAHLWVFTPMS